VKKRKKEHLSVDLHTENARKWAIYGCLAALVVLSLLVRKSLIGFQNGDYTFFSGWYDFAKAHGFHSFKYGYSNYNPPYTYFLYTITLLPIAKMTAIKGLMAVFDIFLAVAVYFVVKIFRPTGYTALIAGITTMFLPTVLVTGVMWGQFDQFYVAAMLLSLYSGLRDNSKWAWIWFGVAIAIKFQAIFFLPVLIIMIFKRIHWYHAFWAVITFLVLTLLPMFAGRSLSSLLDIYPAQSRVTLGFLSLNAPSIYQWFPNSAFPYLYHAGIVVAIAACAFVLLVTLQHKMFSRRELLLCTTLLLYLVPFLLPEMHERYFFPAGIASMIIAFAYPTRLFAGIAVLAQVITLFSYSPFLFNVTPLPFSVLSLGILLIICLYGSQYLRLPKAEPVADS
jgi:Gpi18-like mannosyltransferase